MKKLLMILGGVFAVIVLILGIAAAIFIPRTLKLDRSATAYITDVVPKIVAHWNTQELVDRATPELLSAAKSRKEIDRLFVMFQQLGSLKHLDTPKGGLRVARLPAPEQLRSATTQPRRSLRKELPPFRSSFGALTMSGRSMDFGSTPMYSCLHLPNFRPALDAAVASCLHSEDHLRRASEADRWAG